MTFQCNVSISVGVHGELQASFLNETHSCLVVRFLRDPKIDVYTSGTQVSWANVPMPIRDAVDAEIRRHVENILRKALNPPATLTFQLSPSDDDAAARDHVPDSGERKGAQTAARAGSSLRSNKPVDGGDQCKGMVGSITERSIGLTVGRANADAPLQIMSVVKGSSAAKSMLIHEFDELVEIGTLQVSDAPLELVAELLRWPAGLDRRTRMIQLTLRRQRAVAYANIEQLRPEGDDASEGTSGEDDKQGATASAQRVTSGMRESRSSKREEMHRLPANELVEFESLGMTVEIGALDGISRIRKFKFGGPAEQSELLLIGDQVVMIDRQKVPANISAAATRLRRMAEMLAGSKRLVEVTVKRKGAWGGSETVANVNLMSRPNESSEDEASDYVLVDESDDSADEDAKRRSEEIRRRDLARQSQQQLYRHLTGRNFINEIQGMVTEAIESL